jgi:hypothetical protein
MRMDQIKFDFEPKKIELNVEEEKTEIEKMLDENSGMVFSTQETHPVKQKRFTIGGIAEYFELLCVRLGVEKLNKEIQADAKAVYLETAANWMKNNRNSLRSKNKKEKIVTTDWAKYASDAENMIKRDKKRLGGGDPDGIY